MKLRDLSHYKIYAEDIIKSYRNLMKKIGIKQKYANFIKKIY